MQPINVYLSVDIDYFNNRKRSTILAQFIELGKRVGMTVVGDHQNLLPTVNKTKGRIHLINVDLHSDLCYLGTDPNRSIKRAGCGDWVNYTDIKRQYRFTWVHPTRGFFHCGMCRNDRVKTSDNATWQHCEFTTALPTAWKTATFVGLCLSEDYVRELSPSVVKLIRAIPRKYFTENGLDHLSKYDSQIKNWL